MLNILCLHDESKLVYWVSVYILPSYKNKKVKYYENGLKKEKHSLWEVRK